MEIKIKLASDKEVIDFVFDKGGWMFMLSMLLIGFCVGKCV